MSHAALQLGLTSREAEVLELVVKGYTDKQVAAVLFLSHQAVKANLSAVYAKLGIYSNQRAGANDEMRNARVLVTRWWIENVERPRTVTAASSTGLR